MNSNILIVKESRADEQRVAMVPTDVQMLIKQGHKVYIEQDAGKAAGYLDYDYEMHGASIRHINGTSLQDYEGLFKNIDIIIRVKRPDRSREELENKIIAGGTVMIGALDPFEKDSPHMEEYRERDITIHSIDQLTLPPEDPMNILSAMSELAGRLALLDAIKKFNSIINKVVIIGFGTVGRSAFNEALNQKLPTTVIITNEEHANEIQAAGGSTILLDKNSMLEQQQELVKRIILDADLIITSARKPAQAAPLLIPMDTLQHMRAGSVIIDMALSEGGNVEGSEHDATHTLGNGVIVTNVSGYPKVMPHEASKLWSAASLLFITKLFSAF